MKQTYYRNPVPIQFGDQHTAELYQAEVAAMRKQQRGQYVVAPGLRVTTRDGTLFEPGAEVRLEDIGEMRELRRLISIGYILELEL